MNQMHRVGADLTALSDAELITSSSAPVPTRPSPCSTSRHAGAARAAARSLGRLPLRRRRPGGGGLHPGPVGPAARRRTGGRLPALPHDLRPQRLVRQGPQGRASRRPRRGARGHQPGPAQRAARQRGRPHGGGRLRLAARALADGALAHRGRGSPGGRGRPAAGPGPQRRRRPRLPGPGGPAPGLPPGPPAAPAARRLPGDDHQARCLRPRRAVGARPAQGRRAPQALRAVHGPAPRAAGGEHEPAGRAPAGAARRGRHRLPRPRRRRRRRAPGPAPLAAPTPRRPRPAWWPPRRRRWSPA